jgi:hypothetical protein
MSGQVKSLLWDLASITFIAVCIFGGMAVLAIALR